METNNTNQQQPPVQNIEQSQSAPLPNPSSHSKIFIIVLGITLLAIIGIGGFMLGTRKNQTVNQQPITISPTVSQPSPTATPDETENWKTYRDKEGLFRISYPPRWSENSSEGGSTLGENRIDIAIIVWNDGSTEYAENQWKQIDCAPGNDPNGGCSPSYNKEEKKLSLNSYTVYFRIDGRGQMHAYIPNRAKNKTVEIYSVYLTDRKVFDQILSTFQFLN